MAESDLPFCGHRKLSSEWAGPQDKDIVALPLSVDCGLVCVFRTFLKQEMIKKNNKKKSKYISPFFLLFFWKEKKSYGTWVCELYKKDTHIVLFR